MLSDEFLQLGQHEGDWEYWEQTDKEVVSGHWIIEIEQGKPARLYCDAVARRCFGISANDTPEMCYALWQDNIFSSHIAEMQRHVNEIIMGARGDITYPWKNPAGNTLYLRSIGIRDNRYQNGIRLVGTFQDVTNVICSEQISRRTYLKSDYLLQILADTFEAVHVIQFDQGAVMPVRAILPLFWNARELDITRYLELMRQFIPPKDCELIRKCIIERKVFDNGGNCVTKYSWDFKSDALKKDGCYNILLSLDPNVSKNDMILAIRDVSELENNRNAVSTLKHMSEIDSLTNVFNRAAIEKKMSKYITGHPDEPGLVLLLDLDNFKQINDVFGHIEGDNFLIELAEKLRQFCRSTDIISRLGGDEFMIFMPNVKEQYITSLVSRIINGIRKEYHKADVAFEVTASIGIAHYPEDGRSFAELYHCADLALYNAKRKGKNCYSRYQNTVL
ncbi:GGDEF domain-containing protein [Lawsonibacter sp. LCP25S3_G6]|uniref:GGDEF domain-containing protein n=1 Tax=unclassified Lawsonibacter TaxID=2617946 RepID=UPI003F97BFE6